MNPGIFYRLLLSLTLLFLVSTSFIAYGLINEAKNVYEKVRLHQAHMMAKGLAESSLDFLATNDYELLEGGLRGTTAIDNFAYAYLSKGNGVIISHTDPALVAHKVDSVGEIVAPVVKDVFYLNRPVREVIYPVYLANKHMANAHLAYYMDTKSEYSEEIIIKVVVLLFAILLILSIATFFILRSCLKPVENLAYAMQKVTHNKDYSARVGKQSNDEIGLLVNSFNTMLEQIQQHDNELNSQKENAEKLADEAKIFANEMSLTNNDLENEISERVRIESRLKDLSETLEQRVGDRTKKLEQLNKIIADVSRSAGMAEVASGVLHNVGNVLNSVNISSSIIRGQLLKSSAVNLKKVVTMLNENKGQLGEFMTTNNKGMQVPEFLKLLSDRLQHEHDFFIAELDNLDSNITHIKNIIQMQQSHAGNFSLTEPVQLADLIEDALKINMDKSDFYKIQVVRKFQKLPIMQLDKHNLLQIIINLVSNSKHALLDADIENKVLTIVLSKSANMVVIEVKDNGIGIAKEDLPRLFEYGFTKRKNGHGFGLHNCALVAKTLGGEITAESEGLGTGASFSFSFPVDAGTSHS